MSEDQDFDESGFGGSYSDKKYETVKLPKGGGPGTVLWRPVAHQKFGNKSATAAGVYWKTHFGWKGIDDRDPSKTVFRPITCLEEKRDGMITQKCPLCELRKPYEEKIAKITALGKEKGKTPAEIAKACAPARQWLKDHGLDGKVRIPGYDKKGQPGIFLSPYGMFKSYREKAKQLNQKGLDPAGSKGVFFEFIRSKQASFDSDSCEVHRISTDNEGGERIDVHTITKDLGKLLMDSIPNLDDLKRKDMYTVEQLEELAAMTVREDGSYDPAEVDRILGIVHEGKATKAQSGGGDDGWSNDAPKDETKGDDEVPPAEDDDFEEKPEPKKQPETKKVPETKKQEPPKTPPKKETPPPAEDDWENTFK